MHAKSGLHEGVPGEVLALLGRAKAYRELPNAEREQLAADLTKVAAFLAHRDSTAPSPAAGARADDPTQLDVLRDFPGLTAALANGVFQAIVDASTRQMEAYAELVKQVSQAIDQFTDGNDGNLCDAHARPLARQRQQQLATMVLMGINRIIVTDG